MKFPLLHEMQSIVQLHADPMLLPFVSFILLHATGVYAAQLLPSADSYPAVHSHVFVLPLLPWMHTEFDPQLPLFTRHDATVVLVSVTLDVTLDVVDELVVVPVLVTLLVAVVVTVMLVVNVLLDVVNVDLVVVVDSVNELVLVLVLVPVLVPVLVVLVLLLVTVSVLLDVDDDVGDDVDEDVAVTVVVIVDDALVNEEATLTVLLGWVAVVTVSPHTLPVNPAKQLQLNALLRLCACGHDDATQNAALSNRTSPTLVAVC